ncbi:MAG TPA: SMP-30/gluconolactonase/LRE family protein [Streptosporangiaceae bacterium]|nr:SMP-30/gluconolactonase/LRE family protein [Streptosporangiaceae bacterium]
MQVTAKGRSVLNMLRPAAVPLVVIAMVTALTGPAAAAARRTDVIVLPGATSAEGIAAGRGTTFFAGDLFAGDIFRGDIRRGTAELFIDAPTGRMAVGMKADTRHGLLFVAGGGGHAYVYSTRTRATVADYTVGDATTSFVNDVAVTRRGAWFTDSTQPKLYFVPLDRHGNPGALRTLALSGPAADLSGDFNLNGIQATPDGRTLLVAHSANNAIYRVDPATGASTPIVSITGPDGIVLAGKRLWVVHTNQVTRLRLNASLTSAVVEKDITSDLFQTPSTAALFGHRLGVVNAKFDTGVPPTADQYEVIVVNA